VKWVSFFNEIVVVFVHTVGEHAGTLRVVYTEFFFFFTSNFQYCIHSAFFPSIWRELKAYSNDYMQSSERRLFAVESGLYYGYVFWLERLGA
jgi:hypothetical protein